MHFSFLLHILNHPKISEMSKVEWKILIIWLFTIIALRLCLLLPHRYFEGVQQVNTWIQILIGIIFIVLANKSKGSEKGLYINLSVLYGFVIFKFLSSFIGRGAFIDDPTAGFYYHFYINSIGDAFICILIIFYFVVDYVLREKELKLKYLISSLSAAVLITFLFSSFIFSPSNLKQEQDYITYQKLAKVWTDQTEISGRIPTNGEFLQAISKLPDITNFEYNAIRSEIDTWRDYIKSGAGTALFWRPVAKIITGIDLIIWFTVVILLFIIYKIDKPYYAYMDKVLILILLIYSLEIFHDWSASQISGMEDFRIIFTTSQYFTVFLFLFLVYVLHLKLRFIISPVGLFYGEKLSTQPGQVTRWRDEIDNLILKLFTKRAQSTKRVANINNKRG